MQMKFTYSYPFLLLLFQFLLIFVASKPQDYCNIKVDKDSESELGQLGNVEFISPSLNSQHQIYIQPVSVSISVQLSPAANYDDWMICYTVDNGKGGFLPYCMSIVLKDGGLMFSPLSSTPSPIYDNLDVDYDNQVIAWFSSIKSNGDKNWKVSKCPFKVSKSIPKLNDGSIKYLTNDMDAAGTTHTLSLSYCVYSCLSHCSSF